MATNLINALKFGSDSYNLTLPYGACDNKTTDYAFAVTVDNPSFTLSEGARVAVKFANKPDMQADKTPTLSVNNTTAATIKAHGATLSCDYYWGAGQVVELIYIDSAWHILGASTNTTYAFQGGNPSLDWGKTSTIGSAGGATFKVTMPSNPNTDTKVTAVANHYTPTADANSKLTKNASSTSGASWGSTDFVTGVVLERDAAGHVTGMSVNSKQFPANPNTDTSHAHSAGIGLIGSGSAGVSDGTYDYKVALVNETKDALPSMYYVGTANRFYAVQLDANGKLAVNVPWLAYSGAGSSLGLVKTGGDVTISDGVITVTNDSHSHTASTISGKLTTSHIPNLAASIITSGQFDPARIPNLDASILTSGTIDAARLPSFVDDVIEGNYYADTEKFIATGAGSTAVEPESGKIYVDVTTNKTYRWSGSQYTVISDTLALGSTSSTAHRGDHGAAAYKHAVTNKGSAYTSGFYKITTNSEGHVTSATAVTKSDLTGLGVPGENTAHSHTITGEGLKLTGAGGISGTTDLQLDFSYYASASNAGFMSQAMYNKLAGIAEGANKYTLPVATSSALGGIKIGYSASGANLPVALSSQKAYVALTKDAIVSALGITPTDNVGDITGVTAGNGLTGGGSSGSVTLNIGAGNGISVTADAVALDLNYLADFDKTGLMSAEYYVRLVNHTHSANYTPVGTISKPTFTGTKATVSTKYTPAGTISTPTFTGTAATSGAPSGTTKVNSVTNVGSVSTLTASCSNKCLTLTFTKGAATTVSEVTVGSSTHTHSVTAKGGVSAPTFTGTEATISVEHTPAGTISTPTFTGTAATITSGAGIVAASEE